MVSLRWYRLVGWKYLTAAFLKRALSKILNSNLLLHLSLLMLLLQIVNGDLVVFFLNDLIQVLELGIEVACGRVSVHVWFFDECE